MSAIYSHSPLCWIAVLICFCMLVSLENIFPVIRHSLHNAEHTYRTSMSVRPQQYSYYYCYHSAYFCGVGCIQLKLIQSLINSMYVCDHTQQQLTTQNTDCDLDISPITCCCAGFGCFRQKITGAENWTIIR